MPVQLFKKLTRFPLQDRGLHFLTGCQPEGNLCFWSLPPFLLTIFISPLPLARGDVMAGTCSHISCLTFLSFFPFLLLQLSNYSQEKVSDSNWPAQIAQHQPAWLEVYKLLKFPKSSLLHSSMFRESRGCGLNSFGGDSASKRCIQEKSKSRRMGKHVILGNSQ